MRKIAFATVLLVVAACPFVHAASWNESHDENGNLRPQYKRFQQRTGIDPTQVDPELVEKLTFGHPSRKGSVHRE
jgi:hypothetical protein